MDILNYNGIIIQDSKQTNLHFLFPFNYNQKYTARNNNTSIYCYSNDGPRFGSSYPEIYFNGSLDKGQSFSNLSGNTFLTDRKLTNGDEFWEVKELEVFQIKYL